MKNIIFNCENYSSFGLNLGLLVLRVCTGLMMAFAHGMSKIPPNEQFIGFVQSLGFPSFMSWGASFAEFFGALFITLGLATRLSSISLALTMAVAAFMAHASDPFHKKELALIYLIISVFLFMVGPGKFSLDRMINK